MSRLRTVFSQGRGLLFALLGALGVIVAGLFAFTMIGPKPITNQEACGALTEGMVKARREIGSQKYVAPQAPDASAHLLITEEVSPGHSRARGRHRGRARGRSCVGAPPESTADGASWRAPPQEKEYTRSLTEIKPSLITPEIFGAFARGASPQGRRTRAPAPRPRPPPSRAAARPRCPRSRVPAVDLPAFTLLGTYPGDLYDVETYHSKVPVEDRAYAFGMFRAGDKFAPNNKREVGQNALLVPRRPEDPTSAPETPSSIPYVNEAPVDADYNVVAVTTWAYPLEGVPTRDDPERIATVEYYTCRDVKAGDELYVWYGTKYNRDYGLRSELAHCQSNKELYLGPSGKPQCRVV